MTTASRKTSFARKPSKTNSIPSIHRQSSDVDALLLQETDLGLSRRIQIRFSFLNRQERQALIINLIRQCDPTDMQFLTKKIPKLHRDFIELLPMKISHKILEYCSPKDYCHIVQVSNAWSNAAKDVKLWQKLYARIGLVAMTDAYYIPHVPMVYNAKRLYSLGNWSKGLFTFKKFRAHPLGILCVAFDGHYIVVYYLKMSYLNSEIDWKCR